jgi:hypothetical protein
MFLSFAPCGDGCLIAEERQRKNLAGLGQALEPFDREKSINAFKDGPQRRSKVEVFLLFIGFGPHLENNCIFNARRRSLRQFELIALINLINITEPGQCSANSNSAMTIAAAAKVKIPANPSTKSSGKARNSKGPASSAPPPLIMIAGLGSTLNAKTIMIMAARPEVTSVTPMTNPHQKRS